MYDDPSDVLAASADDVLETVTFAANGASQYGNIPVNESFTKLIGCGETFEIPPGYHEGTSTVKMYDLADLTKIDNGASPSDIVFGKTAWINGSKITGTMKPVEDTSIEALEVTDYGRMVFKFVIPGYRNDGSYVILPNETYTGYMMGLDSSNIAAGKSLFGIKGTYTSDATATSKDIIVGKSAFVNGNKISGTLKVNSLF